MRKLLFLSAAGLVASLSIWAAVQEKVDLSVLNRIKSEAFEGSKVMDTAFYLTDVYGPRLTGSPNVKAAGEWAVKKMKEWGLSNVKFESWGPFGRGWSTTRYVAMMTEPEFSPLIGFARPWSPGTDGPVTGDAVLAVITTADDFPKFRGKLKGKMVLTSAMHASQMITVPLSLRLTDTELADAATSPDPAMGNPPALPLGFVRTPTPAVGGRGATPDRRAIRQFRSQLNKFLKDEGVLVAITPGNGADGGTVFGQSAGSQNADEETPPPSVVITNEHYNRIVRLLAKNIPVKLEFDIKASFSEPADSFNITAEIPGTKPGAGVVMLGGHFDSWTGGTGATDNAAGSAVAMEAIRILKALDLKMDRTVRVALWTGEEEGTLGSRAYVKAHFADPTDMKLKPEHAQLSAYYNLDNGTGKIRGIYMQNNDMLRPLFKAWLDPLQDLGANTLTIRNTGSTDHIPFDNVGLPAFQFIQDPLEYSSRTHHSNMDTYDHLQAGDLEQSSAVMAWVVYNTATRAEMMPRKPLPKPRPNRSPGEGGSPPTSTGAN